MNESSKMLLAVQLLKTIINVTAMKLFTDVATDGKDENGKIVKLFSTVQLFLEKKSP